jgi:replicative DNA helicase
MSEDKDSSGFGFLGIPYQQRLLAQLINDHRFASNILSIVDPNYFTDMYLRMIAKVIVDAYEVDEVVPDKDSLMFRLNAREDNETIKLFLKATLEKITDGDLNDSDFVQNMAMKFCKQQELKKSVSDIQNIIDKGDLDSYDECEEILKKALEIGSNKDAGIDVFYDIEDVLSENFRNPIPTGISGLDDKMGGGLSKGELGVILAPFGVGKTTMITKLANEAYTHGHNVLQIFFEDIPKVIQRKHLSCWTKIPLNDLSIGVNRPMIDAAMIKHNDGKGYLELKKFSSDGTTIPMIKNYVRKLAASGRKPDIILLDYIDCVTSNKTFNAAYEAEGPIMRQFESLLSEFDMVGWTAIQGNRSSIGADTVDSTMIGGSIKKGQIGHFIVSIAKDLDQKETGRANMAILKSRFGVDGIIFSDIEFDNARIQISIDNGNVMKASEMDDYKQAKGTERVGDLLTQFDNDKKAKLKAELIDLENKK